MVGKMTAKTETELTAYCGLYCGDCPRYRSRAVNLAAELLNDFKAWGFGRYAEAKSRSANAIPELADFEQCCRVLEGIVALKCPEPCRVGGGCPQFSCGIIKCCWEKGYQGCWECRDYKKCEQFASLKPFHGENHLRNLEEIKKYGPEKWAEHRHPYFIWEQR